MIKPQVWEDQAEFNRQLRAVPPEDSELNALLKEFTLHMTTEVTEFLNAAGVFGLHRRLDDPPLVNGENVRRQLVDIFKYWMSLCQLLGYSPEQMEATYWRKSATVRQRHAEEWLTTLEGPVTILDLDGVLCDYIEGLFQWMEGRWNISNDVLDAIRRERMFVTAETLNMSLQEWNRLNHEFRACGGFATLPALPHAAEFVEWCRDQGRQHVVVLTSRPIDAYPNIYDDTVAWFRDHAITVDKIWWGPNKAEKLAAVQRLLPEVRFAIDDDPRYVKQFVEAGVPRVYWYMHGYGKAETTRNVVSITDLKQVMQMEGTPS